MAAPKPSQKIRVIARIRGFADGRKPNESWISVHKPNGEESDMVSLSFGAQSASQKESYQVHNCYGPDEDSNKIYISEIKPLISGVFDGRNATVIAYGARDSGKTFTILGSERWPGLAALAIEDITAMAERVGGSVTVSVYEIYEDRIYDLLNPQGKVVSMYEDAQGRIKLKGLSMVPVKSGSEFSKLYFGGCSSHKMVNKVASDLSRNGHKGLIFHVTSPAENSDTLLFAKMNFVDLAGYENPRKKSSDGLSLVEKNKLNKSLYALQKVIHALNANESHVPFRESKITRLLQDSLGGSNRLTIIACLNASFCQDSIYMATLASRTCQRSHPVTADPTKKCKTSEKLVMVSSSSNTRILGSASTTAKKKNVSNVSQVLSLKKNSSRNTSALKGKKLFGEASNSHKAVKGKFVSSIDLTDQLGIKGEKVSTSIVECSIPGEGNSCSSVVLIDELGIDKEAAFVEDVSFLDEENKHEVCSNVSCSKEALPLIDRGIIGEENSNFKESGSPSLSTRLQELSNNLKLLYSSTPSRVGKPNEYKPLSDIQNVVGVVEPKTPTIDTTIKVNGRLDMGNIDSPLAASRTCYSETKSSLIQEYLKFINSASKEELKRLKGIGEKRATYILQLREDSPEPFKSLDDLQDVGLSTKQIKKMLALK